MLKASCDAHFPDPLSSTLAVTYTRGRTQETLKRVGKNSASPLHRLFQAAVLAIKHISLTPTLTPLMPLARAESSALALLTIYGKSACQHDGGGGAVGLAAEVPIP